MNANLDDSIEHLIELRSDPRPAFRLAVRERILSMLNRRIENQTCICDLVALRDFVLREQLNDKKGDA